MALEVDVHRRRRMVARGQRIALPDVVLGGAVADHRDPEGERHAVVLPDAGGGAQHVFVVEQMGRMVGRSLDDANPRPAVGEAAHDLVLRIVAEAGEIGLAGQQLFGPLEDLAHGDRLVGQSLDAQPVGVLFFFDEQFGEFRVHHVVGGGIHGVDLSFERGM